MGIFSRRVPLGWEVWDRHLGDSLYAMAVYLFVVLLTRWSPFPHAFVAALLICLAIELFKLTGLPMAWRGFLLARWVLGTAFSAHNLLLYGAGLVAIAFTDRYGLRPGVGQN